MLFLNKFLIWWHCLSPKLPYRLQEDTTSYKNIFALTSLTLQSIIALGEWNSLSSAFIIFETLALQFPPCRMRSHSLWSCTLKAALPPPHSIQLLFAVPCPAQFAEMTISVHCNLCSEAQYLANPRRVLFGALRRPSKQCPAFTLWSLWMPLPSKGMTMQYNQQWLQDLCP